MNISIHALREEGDPLVEKSIMTEWTISIHALREEGDKRRRGERLDARRISIHALREEGDPTLLATSSHTTNFYPRPPRGRRRRPTRRTAWQFSISIHALREEGDLLGTAALIQPKEISIHALREEGDKRADAPFQKKSTAFLSTPSARKATGYPGAVGPVQGDFYPRPPRGRRPCRVTAFARP